MTSEHKYQRSEEGKRKVFQAENCMGKGLEAKMSKAELQVASERNPTHWLKLKWNILVHSEAHREECLASSTGSVSLCWFPPWIALPHWFRDHPKPWIQPDWPGQVTCPSLNQSDWPDIDRIRLEPLRWWKKGEGEEVCQHQGSPVPVLMIVGQPKDP